MSAIDLMDVGLAGQYGATSSGRVGLLVCDGYDQPLSLSSLRGEAEIDEPADAVTTHLRVERALEVAQRLYARLRAMRSDEAWDMIENARVSDDERRILEWCDNLRHYKAVDRRSLPSTDELHEIVAELLIEMELTEGEATIMRHLLFRTIEVQVK